MPIEIKELHIRAVVNEPPEPSGGSANVNRPASGSSAPADDSSGDKDDIVAECVEKVLDILRQRNEY